jgi:hypothetical protein
VHAVADATMKNSEKQHVAGEDSNHVLSAESQSVVYDNVTLQRARSPEKRLLKPLCLSYLGLGGGHMSRELFTVTILKFYFGDMRENP